MKKDFIHRAGKDIILLVHQIILNCIIEAILKLQAEVTFEFHRDWACYDSHRWDFLSRLRSTEQLDTRASAFASTLAAPREERTLRSTVNVKSPPFHQDPTKHISNSL